MSKKSFIDSVEVRKPCTENWDKMHGNDRVRFCDHCAKDVKNLSAVTRKEAMRLVRASGGNICIRYMTNPVTHRPLFADQLFQITRRAPSLAAGVMTASLSLSTLAYAQSDSATAISTPSIVRMDEKKLIDPPSSDENNNKSKTAPTPSSRIKGTIVDPNGAVIQNAKVTIFSVSAGKTESTVSDGEGVYRFDQLEPGTYRLESESPGFKTGLTEVTVSDRSEALADVSLGIGLEASVEVIANVQLEIGGEIMAMGVMASVDYSSPLAKAVANDDIEEVRGLIVKGANVNGKDENYDKITPLFIAVENGNVEIARMLLDFGAKINAKDGGKQTPLMRLDDDATPELVELLLQYGAKINLADKEGNTALILAARSVKPEVLRVLINADADINLANKEGQTALMNAADSENVESVRALLETGAKVNLKNKEGETAWDLASNEDIETLLVSFGADVKESAENSPNDAPRDD